TRGALAAVGPLRALVALVTRLALRTRGSLAAVGPPRVLVVNVIWRRLVVRLVARLLPRGLLPEDVLGLALPGLALLGLALPGLLLRGVRGGRGGARHHQPHPHDQKRDAQDPLHGNQLAHDCSFGGAHPAKAADARVGE